MLAARMLCLAQLNRKFRLKPSLSYTDLKSFDCAGYLDWLTFLTGS